MVRKKTGRWPDGSRDQDRGLWDFYDRHMIQPGWAGVLSAGQVRYIEGVLSKKIKSPYLKSGAQVRHRWGFGPGQDKITGPAIQEVAMWGDPDDPDHNARLVRRANERQDRKAGQLLLWDDSG